MCRYQEGWLFVSAIINGVTLNKGTKLNLSFIGLWCKDWIDIFDDRDDIKRLVRKTKGASLNLAKVKQVCNERLEELELAHYKLALFNDIRNVLRIEGLCTQHVSHMLKEKNYREDWCSHFMTDGGSVSLSLLRDLFLLVPLDLKKFFVYLFCLIADLYCICWLSSKALLSDLHCYKAVSNIRIASFFSLLFY